MRPDFQCGICRERVPEFYYGGCCAICDRIRCNNCMRQCPSCGAQLCPECLGPARADGACAHVPLPPRRPLLPDGAATPRWQPPPRAASPLQPDPQPAPARAWPGWRWLAMLVAALLVVPVYALLELLLADLAPPLALLLAGIGGGELPAWLARAALPLGLVLAAAIIAARAEPRWPLVLPAGAALLALALQLGLGFNEFAHAVGLPLAAVYAGLCTGGAFGALWSQGGSWRRALVGALVALPLAVLADARIEGLGGLAFVLVHLLLLVLLPLLLRAPRRARAG